jgi:hypothetical protein
MQTAGVREDNILFRSPPRKPENGRTSVTAHDCFENSLHKGVKTLSQRIDSIDELQDVLKSGNTRLAVVSVDIICASGARTNCMVDQSVGLPNQSVG